MHGTAPVGLSRESEQAVARAIDTTDAVDVPLVLFLGAGYKFGSKEYAYADPQTLAPTSATHLGDVAQMLVGAQFRVRANDPGYFVAFSFNYSSLFHDADGKIGPPDRLFGTLLRLDMRRPFIAAHLGINPSLTYELDTRVKTIEAATYWWFAPRRFAHPELDETDRRRQGRVSERARRTVRERVRGPVFGVRP